MQNSRSFIITGFLCPREAGDTRGKEAPRGKGRLRVDLRQRGGVWRAEHLRGGRGSPGAGPVAGPPPGAAEEPPVAWVYLRGQDSTHKQYSANFNVQNNVM